MGKNEIQRDKDIEEPILMLTHYWKLSDKTNLTTNGLSVWFSRKYKN